MQQGIGRTIREIKQRGFTVLLVEQNFRFAATVADRHWVMEHGRVVDMIQNAALEASMDKLYEYLGFDSGAPAPLPQPPLPQGRGRRKHFSSPRVGREATKAGRGGCQCDGNGNTKCKGP